MAHIGLVTLLVRDYDEAIAFFTEKLGFELREDSPQGNGKRWVVVIPVPAQESGLLLARASTPEQQRRIGNQTGGRVGFFLRTDNFDADYLRMKKAGVAFEEEPRSEGYGKVAVFKDLYGNRWDLVGS